MAKGGSAEDQDEAITAFDLATIDRTEWNHRTVYGTGETRKGYSWIWFSGGKIDLEDGADEGDNEILRSEWCKSRARANRATEEVLLIREEMRRTLAYLAWMAEQWETRASAFSGRSAEDEGKRAFALTQAKLQQELRAHFESLWTRARLDADAERAAERTSQKERKTRTEEVIVRAEELAENDEDNDEEMEDEEDEEDAWDRLQGEESEAETEFSDEGDMFSNGGWQDDGYDIAAGYWE
ncbi:hypothetical protein VNI00_016763 [Paramarasmius palmivorus]|uniref:Uncharacterized protein n=1 Tax=Paramarasmius palmivorus TaxID=297713 RepID=A0AAW0BCL2_9AGAR